MQECPHRFLSKRRFEKSARAASAQAVGQADDVVNAVVYLQSEAAQYVSGHQLVVDGGVVGSLLAHLPRGNGMTLTERSRARMTKSSSNVTSLERVGLAR